MIIYLYIYITGLWMSMDPPSNYGGGVAPGFL